MTILYKFKEHGLSSWLSSQWIKFLEQIYYPLFEKCKHMNSDIINFRFILGV